MVRIEGVRFGMMRDILTFAGLAVLFIATILFVSGCSADRVTIYRPLASFCTEELECVHMAAQFQATERTCWMIAEDGMGELLPFAQSLGPDVVLDVRCMPSAQAEALDPRFSPVIPDMLITPEQSQDEENAGGIPNDQNSSG